MDPDFQQKIEKEFDEQTPEQIQELIRQCRFNFNDNSMIMGIISVINKNKQISFNQWKALRAHLSKNNNPKKTI